MRTGLSARAANAGERARTTMPIADRDQHDRDDLHDLAELQAELAVGVEVRRWRGW